MLALTLPRLPALSALTLAFAVLVGLCLCLFGRRTLRLACSICGLILGGLIGYVGAHLAGHEQWILFYLIGGAISGCATAALLFRLWMGVSLAALLPLLIALGGLFWQGPFPRALTTMPAGTSAPPAAAATTASAPGSPSAPNLAGLAYQGYHDQAAALSDWWRSLGQPAQKNLLIAFAIAAGVGLFIGLLKPDFAAGIETSLVGAGLIVIAGRGLLALHAPDQAAFLATHPRAVLAALGLITLGGIMVQCTFRRRRADKKPSV